MDIKASKIVLAKTILDINDPKVIKKIYSLLRDEKVDLSSHLTTDQIKEIKLGLEQLDNGQGNSFEDFIKKVS